MASPDRVAAVAELQEKFTSSAGAVLTEYRGLTVKALKELRRSLGEDATYAVSKNTLTTIAARQAGIDGLDEHLVGPTAIAFFNGDPVTVAKGLRDFGRTNPLLIIKGGILDGRFLTPDEVRRMADLETREVLLAKVAGGLSGVLQQAVSLFAAPLSQAARVIAALEAAAVENPSLLAASAPAAEHTATPDHDEPTVEPTPDPSTGQQASDEPSNDGPVTDQPSNEPTAEAAPAVDDTNAAPAAEPAPEAPAAGDPDPIAADAAQEN